MMNINSIKLPVGKILIALWIVFSIAYIIFDMYDKFKTNVVNSAYYAGQENAVVTMINNLEKDCKSITLYDKKSNKQIDVTNVECFKNKDSQTSTGTALKPNK